jgi:hypothetical protein
MPDAKPRGDVVPVIASTTQVVEIHWRCPDGTVVVERRIFAEAIRDAEVP